MIGVVLDGGSSEIRSCISKMNENRTMVNYARDNTIHMATTEFTGQI